MAFVVWVAPEYGFMPVRHHLLRKSESENEAIFIRRYKDYIRLSNGVWFPQRIMGSEKDEWGGWYYKNIDISTVPDNVFNPQLPANTWVIDRSNGRKYMVNKRGE